MFVLRPDQQYFQGTAVTVDVAGRLRVPKLLLLINKALVEYDFEDLRQQVEQNYQAPVAAIIPEFHDILRLASSGIFCLHYPNHAISLAIEKVAQQIVN